jgi:hypothetical protein
MVQKILLGSALTAAFILTGCGSSSDPVETTTSTLTTTDTTSSTSTTGYLVDSAVINADYDCIADNDYNKTTGADGAFSCQNMSQVRFRIGELVLGEITGLPADGYVMPQDLAGVAREGTLMDPSVTALAQLLQSLDEDQDPTNGIVIPDHIKAVLDNETFNPDDVTVYLAEASVPVVSTTQAQSHLRETLQTIQGGGGNTGDQGHNGDPADLNITTSPTSTLTPELEEALAHMGNEERLAYDVYYNLYNYHADQGTEIFQLYNISQNSERTHVGIVQSLVQKYDLGADDIPVVDSSITDAYNMSNGISFEEMPSGIYDIPAIQSLYDSLYAKGITSQRDALEVGCMVEVVDINDLDEYIEMAENADAQDVIDAFTVLREGSYSHYWAFNKGLVNIGVTDGCCSLGAEWCHTEYPQNDKGGGNNGTGTPGGGHGHP